MHSERLSAGVIGDHPLDDFGVGDAGGNQRLDDPGNGDRMVRAVGHRENVNLHLTDSTAPPSPSVSARDPADVSGP